MKNLRSAHAPALELVADAEPEAETVDIPPPPPQGIRPRPGPLLIQLAAGMAVSEGGVVGGMQLLYSAYSLSA